MKNRNNNTENAKGMGLTGLKHIVTVGEIFDFLDEIAPFERQEAWDNAGFLVGGRGTAVSKALLALDPTTDVMRQAKNAGAQLVVAHHPVIFRALKSFTDGNAAYEAAKNGVSVIAAHTNYDAARDGVNDVLAGILELEYRADLFIAEEKQALLRSGTVPPQTSREFAAFIKIKLGAGVRYNLPEKQITSVAVCGGAGAEFIEKVAGLGFDAFVTGDANHHNFLDAAERGLALFAAGHFETENPAVIALRDRLAGKFEGVEFMLAEQSSPILFA